MKETEDLTGSVIFPKGEILKSDNFIGTVWLNMLTGADTPLPVANVTFEPGCRNNWHKHKGGQVLLVTGGRGWYEEWGIPALELLPGDVVQIPAEVKHWHGAAHDSWFVHLAIEIHSELRPAQWLEPVSDEEYNKLR